MLQEILDLREPQKWDLSWHQHHSEILKQARTSSFSSASMKIMKIRYIHLAKLCVCLSLLLFLMTLWDRDTAYAENTESNIALEQKVESERIVGLKAVTSLPDITPHKCVNTSALHRGESSWHRPATVWPFWCRFEGSHLCEGSPGGRVGVWRHPRLGSLGEGDRGGGHEDHRQVPGGCLHGHWLQYWSVLLFQKSIW